MCSRCRFTLKRFIFGSVSHTVAHEGSSQVRANQGRSFEDVSPEAAPFLFFQLQLPHHQICCHYLHVSTGWVIASKRRKMQERLLCCSSRPSCRWNADGPHGEDGAERPHWSLQRSIIIIIIFHSRYFNLSRQQKCFLESKSIEKETNLFSRGSFLSNIQGRGCCIVSWEKNLDVRRTKPLENSLYQSRK